METIVLAAGRGARLEGLAAPFWKPLMVVNGEPLVVTVVRQGVTINLGRCVVVVSPENAQPICSVLEANRLTGGVDIVVQPTPGGPGEAFLCASPMLNDKHRAMILCADNVIPDDDIKEVASTGGAGCPSLVIGTRVIEDAKEAARFTLVSQAGSIWEGGEDRADLVWDDRRFRAWVGPLVVNPAYLTAALIGQPKNGELKIGAHLNEYCDLTGEPPVLVPCDCYDVGVPE